MKYKILKIIYILISYIMLCYSDSFQVQLGIQNAEITLADWYNYFGISSSASDGWDSFDVRNMFSPEPHYIDLYFPHDDPDRPDYWLPPYSGKYSSDIRNDSFAEKIFYFDIYSTSTSMESIALFWVELDSVAPTYKIEISPIHESGVNIFSQDTLWQNIAPGVHYYTVDVKKNAYSHIITLPENIFLKIGEKVWIKTYLVGPSDTLEIFPQITISGDAANISGNIVEGIHNGISTITTNFRGFSDTNSVVVYGIGQTIRIPIYRGWNLISFPVMPSNPVMEFVMGNLYQFVYVYDKESDNFFVPESIRTGEGYFVFSNSDTILEFVGEAVPSVNVNLFPGWNVIGGPAFRVNWSDIIHDSDGIYLSKIFELLGNNYLPQEFLSPGYGYWVFVSDSINLTLTP